MGMEKNNKMMEAKTISETKVEIAQLMMPEHGNSTGNVHGGTIMKIMDNAAAIVAARHAQRNVVTASVDKLDFLAPAYIGNLVIAKASLNYVSRTSMEIGVRIEAENIVKGDRTHAATAYLTFVALDLRKRPTEVPRLITETEEEKKRYEAARKRRERRLEDLKKKHKNTQ